MKNLISAWAILAPIVIGLMICNMASLILICAYVTFLISNKNVRKIFTKAYFENEKLTSYLIGKYDE